MDRGRNHGAVAALTRGRDQAQRRMRFWRRVWFTAGVVVPALAIVALAAIAFH